TEKLRAMKSIFARELRDALIRNLIALAVVSSVFYFAEKLSRGREGPITGLTDIVGVLTLLGLILAPFVCGERAFPPDLKERRLVYLSVLPVRRGHLWLAVFGAHLFSALIPAGLAALDLRVKGTRQSWEDYCMLAIAFVFLFTTGSTLALALRRVFAVYIAGLVMTGAILFEMLELFPPPVVASFAAGVPALPVILFLLLMYLFTALKPYWALSSSHEAALALQRIVVKAESGLISRC